MVERYERCQDGVNELIREAFRRDLYERGLEGKPLALALVVIGGNPGLHRTLDTVYPYVPRQRCWVHKLRDVAG